MSNVFSSSEIVEIGIQIEKNGRDFYNALAEKSKNPQAREIFKFLAGEEEKHIVVFQEILEKVEKYEPPESYPGEYFAYMKGLASEHIFTKRDQGKQQALKASDEKQAVDMGMGFEQDSIIFYEGMKKVVPEFSQKIVDELIIQEQGHLKQLGDLKKTLV